MLLLFNVNLHKVCFNWISNTSLITYFCSGLLARFTSLCCNSHSFWDLWYACCFSSHLPTSPSSHSCAVKTKLLTCSSLTPPLPFFHLLFPFTLLFNLRLLLNFPHIVLQILPRFWNSRWYWEEMSTCCASEATNNLATKFYTTHLR